MKMAISQEVIVVWGNELVDGGLHSDCFSICCLKLYFAVSVTISDDELWSL